jgi:hypothetical protein
MTIQDNAAFPKKENFQIPEDSVRQRMEDSPFFCSEYFHLAELSPVCALIYGLAYRISKSSRMRDRGGPKGTLHCSAESLAIYFDRHVATVRSSLKELVKLGFFELLNAGKFRPNVYRVLSHDEWAEKHPGRCATKLTFPYSAESDELGQALWNISGGLVTFKAFQVRNLRRLGLAPERVIELFAEYWEKTGVNLPAMQVPIDFQIRLKQAAHREHLRAA